MEMRELIESLFGVKVTNVQEADEIDEGRESTALLAREAARTIMEDDQPTHVMELDGGGFVAAGSSCAILMSPDGALDVRDYPENGSEQDEGCGSKHDKKVGKKRKDMMGEDDEARAFALYYADCAETVTKEEAWVVFEANKASMMARYLDEGQLDERKRKRMQSAQRMSMLRSRKTQTPEEKQRNRLRRKLYKRNRLKIARLRKRVTASDDRAYYMLDSENDQLFLDLLTDAQVAALDIDDSGLWIIPEADLDDDLTLIATDDSEELAESMTEQELEEFGLGQMRNAKTIHDLRTTKDKFYYVHPDGLIGFKRMGEYIWYKYDANKGSYVESGTTSGSEGAQKKAFNESVDVIVAFPKDAARDFLRMTNRAGLTESPSIATHGNYMYAALPKTVAECLSMFFEAEFLDLGKTVEEAIFDLVAEVEHADSKSDIVSTLTNTTPWVTKKLAEQAVRRMLESEALTLAEGLVTVDPAKLPEPSLTLHVGPGAGDGKRPTWDQQPDAPKTKKTPWESLEIEEAEYGRLARYMGEDMLSMLTKPQVQQIKDETPVGLKALGKLLKGKSDAECKQLLAATIGESEDLDEGVREPSIKKTKMKMNGKDVMGWLVTGTDKTAQLTTDDEKAAKRYYDAEMKKYKKAAKGATTLEDLDEAKGAVFKTVGGMNYATNLPGSERPDSLDVARAAQAFQKTAKSTHVGAKGKSTMAAVKKWVSERKPAQFYARWKADSPSYKDDSVQVWFTVDTTEGLDEEGMVTVYQLSKFKDGATHTGTKKITRAEWSDKKRFPRNDSDYVWTTKKPDAADIGKDGKITNWKDYVIEYESESALDEEGMVKSPGEKVALELLDYHGGGGSGIYAVGSTWLAKKPVPAKELVRAIAELGDFNKGKYADQASKRLEKMLRSLGESDLDEKAMPKVGQEVRIKKGKSIWTGKITKVNPDGSYEYEDSDGKKHTVESGDENYELVEAKGVPCECDECGYEAMAKPGTTCPECEEGTMEPVDDEGDDEDGEDDEDVDESLSNDDLIGLKKWVKDYVTAKGAGNDKMAAKIKSNIDKQLQSARMLKGGKGYKLIGMPESVDENIDTNLVGLLKKQSDQRQSAKKSTKEGDDADLAETTLTCKKSDVQGFIKALRACGVDDSADVVIEGEEVKITVSEAVAERVKTLMEGQA